MSAIPANQTKHSENMDEYGGGKRGEKGAEGVGGNRKIRGDIKNWSGQKFGGYRGVDGISEIPLTNIIYPTNTRRMMTNHESEILQSRGSLIGITADRSI